MKTAPCYECCNRHKGCHDKCDFYKEYQDKKATQSPEDREFADYLYCAVRRMKGESI